MAKIERVKPALSDIRSDVLLTRMQQYSYAGAMGCFVSVDEHIVITPFVINRCCCCFRRVG